MIQATKWLAQMNDGSKITGGLSGDPNVTQAVNVSEVDVAQLKVFTISHNTFAHTYYVPGKKWYGTSLPYVYPTQYLLQDGTVLTVDYDATEDQLVLIQV